MAWNDFSNMPWMQTSKPGEALLRGVEAGSGVASNMNRSRSLQLEANEQSHLLPLKQQMMETQVKEGALQLATGLKAQEYDLQTKQGQAELADVYTKAATVPDGWANPQVRGWMGEVGKKYPALVGTPAWQHGDQNVEKALSINAEQKRAETAATSRENVAGTRTLSAEEIARIRADAMKEVGAGHDATKLELAKTKTLLEAKDMLPQMVYREYSEGVKAIYADPTVDLATKNSSATALLGKLSRQLPKKASDIPTAKPVQPPGYQPAVIGNMPNVTSKDEYDKLPLGTKYVRDGETFIKK